MVVVVVFGEGGNVKSDLDSSTTNVLSPIQNTWLIANSRCYIDMNVIY